MLSSRRNVVGMFGAMQELYRKQAEAAELARQQAAEAAKLRMGMLEWARLRRALLAPGQALDFDAHPYLLEPYADGNKHRVTADMKSSQSGLSEWAITLALWNADVHGYSTMYLFPTDGDVSEFSAARFAPAIEEGVSPYLASIVGGDIEGARSVDRVTLKRVRNAFIYFRGAKIGKDGQAPQLKSVPAGQIIYDEFDEMDYRVPGIARERLSHSKLAAEHFVSTPTFPNYGIHALYLSSTQCVYMLKCPACGKWNEPTPQRMILESDTLGRPLSWNVDEHDRACMACEFCEAILRGCAGEWVPKYPNREVWGRHTSRLFASHRPLDTIITGLRSSKEDERQQMTNQGLGLPYLSPSARSMTPDILEKCKRDYPHKAMQGGGRVFAGIDVGDKLHVTVREHTADGSYKLLMAGEYDSFPEVTNLVMRRFGVRICVVDRAPETRAAEAFQAAHAPGVVWLAIYTEGNKKDDAAVWDLENGIVTIDRTRMLDETFGRFYDASEGLKLRTNTLPAEIDGVPDYIKQLCAPKRVLRRARTTEKKVAVYVHTDPDHYAHSENYTTTASLCPFAAGWAMGAGG